MSAHDHHEALPGFHPDQLLVTGCTECEVRGKHVEQAIGHLDAERFVHAWERAGLLQRNGMRNLSYAEMPLLWALGAVQVQLERRGWPIGTIPSVNVAAS